MMFDFRAQISKSRTNAQPNGPVMDTIEQLLETQKQALIEEVQAGEDRAAFIPSLDNEAVLDATAVRDAFLQCVQQHGYRRVRIPHKSYDDVIILMDRKGRASIWVERSLPQKKCRTAFRHFINMFTDGQQIRSIDGVLHVDHAYNKARVLNPQPLSDDTQSDTEPGISAGYLRLFLIDESVNTSYGSGIETLRSRQNEQQGGFRLCTWMMLLKLTGFMPPRSDDDHASAIAYLNGLFGDFGVKETTIRAGVKAEFLQGAKFHVVMSQQGETILNDVEFREYLHQHRFERSRYARLIRDLFGWTIFTVKIDGREELALKLDSSEWFYLMADPYRIVFKPDVIATAWENSISAHESILEETDIVAPYLKFIEAANDDIRSHILSCKDWKSKVCGILTGQAPITGCRL